MRRLKLNIARRTPASFIDTPLFGEFLVICQTWKNAKIITQPNFSSKTLTLQYRGNYSATSNNMKLIRWQLMGGLLHLVQQGWDWAGPQTAQAPPRCTECNNPPINGQCPNLPITVLLYIMVCCFAVLICP